MPTPSGVGTPPIQIKASDWQEAQRVLATQVPGLEVWAFGSRARGTAKPYSDLDVALVSPHPLPLSVLANLNYAFEASDMTIKVDVVDLSSVSEAFRSTIARDAVAVQHGSASTLGYDPGRIAGDP